jgi:hypothetical protein
MCPQALICEIAQSGWQTRRFSSTLEASLSRKRVSCSILRRVRLHTEKVPFMWRILLDTKPGPVHVWRIQHRRMRNPHIYWQSGNPEELQPIRHARSVLIIFRTCWSRANKTISCGVTMANRLVLHERQHRRLSTIRHERHNSSASQSLGHQSAMHPTSRCRQRRTHFWAPSNDL